MALELIVPADQYELQHASGAVFVMRYWTTAMQEDVDRRCISVDQATKELSYNAPLEREIKIEQCLVSWRGVASKGKEIECSPESKKMLPPGVRLWIIKDVDERAGLRMPEDEKKT